MKSSLPPIDTTEDIEHYQAKAFKQELRGGKCAHSRAKMLNSELRCPCGAAWTGPRISELLQVLTTQ